MRTTPNISFPDDLYIFVRERVDEGSFTSVSEYIRALVRADYSRSEVTNRRGEKRRRTIARSTDVHRMNDLMAGLAGNRDR
jgi:Arc/MetJ-type ribon-helix-helix transcriptional regulator